MNFCLILFSYGLVVSVDKTDPYNLQYARLKMTWVFRDRSKVLIAWGEQHVRFESDVALADGSEHRL